LKASVIDGKSLSFNIDQETAKFEVNDEKGRVISVTGNIPEIVTGIQYRINGNYLEHPRYGMQFQIQTLAKLLPTEKESKV